MIIDTNASITFGYSDSEDRLWSRLIGNNGEEARLWITRLLCKKTCLELIKLLEKSTPTHKIENTGIVLNQSATLAEEFMQAKNKPSDPSPELKKKSHTDNFQSTEVEVCHSIEIKQGKLWQITFLLKNNKNVKLSVNRKGIFRILSTLISQSKNADWCLQLNPEWLEKKSI